MEEKVNLIQYGYKILDGYYDILQGIIQTRTMLPFAPNSCQLRWFGAIALT